MVEKVEMVVEVGQQHCRQLVVRRRRRRWRWMEKLVVVVRSLQRYRRWRW